MKLYFTNKKEINSFEVLLPEISFKYCDNPDGEMYAMIVTDIKSNYDIAKELIHELNSLLLSKKSVIILNLLVNPYFDELCMIISNCNDLSKRKKAIIKKYVFSYLSSDKANYIFSIPNIRGNEIYKKKNMYLISKKILSFI